MAWCRSSLLAQVPIPGLVGRYKCIAQSGWRLWVGRSRPEQKWWDRLCAAESTCPALAPQLKNLIVGGEEEVTKS